MIRIVLALQVLLMTSSSAFAAQTTNDSVRVSITGAEFNRDTTIPSLGVAYRDPSGVIWGEIAVSDPATPVLGEVYRDASGKWSIKPGDPAIEMNQAKAKGYCAHGTRLPRVEEFNRLSKYLGLNSAKGYSPYMADGKTEILPGLSTHMFWSSTEISGKCLVDPDMVNHFWGHAYGNCGVYFIGYNADLIPDIPVYVNAVMCVAGAN